MSSSLPPSVRITDRQGRQTIELPDGRTVRGRIPGLSGTVHLEHYLRDELARRIRGVTEANLPYGRPDVMTDQAVFEVEPLAKWRNGVRQVLAYSAQTGLEPTLALFGAAKNDQVLKLYLKLRDGSPRVHLWWYSGRGWESVHSRRCCTVMRAPDEEWVRQRCEQMKPQRVFLGDYL